MTHEGLESFYIAYVPSNYTGQKAVPLVIDLHGNNGKAEEYSLPPNNTQIPEAEKRGAIVIFPQAWNPPNEVGGFWNAYSCCIQETHPYPNIDSVGFLRKVVADVKARSNIDNSQVFMTGNSAGGAMTHRVACDAPDLARVFIPEAHMLARPELCNPSTPPNVFQVNGLIDPIILYTGTPIPGPLWGGPLDTPSWPSAQDSFSSWATINGCTGSPISTPVGLLSEMETYIHCENGSRISLTTVGTGGHNTSSNAEGFNLAKHFWERIAPQFPKQ